MTVSVVIPAYRAVGTICRAIDSILAQTVPVYEIIVVDDGSPDDLADCVKRTYGDRVTVLRRENGGVSVARNAGIDYATGDLIAFLDADDYWEPRKIERQLEVFRRHPEVAIVAGQFRVQRPEGELRERVVNEEFFDRVLHCSGARAFRAAIELWTGMVVVRREALENERFAPEVDVMEDIDMWVRLVSQHPTFLISEPLAIYIIQKGSLYWSNNDREYRNMIYVVERHRQLLGRIATRQWLARSLFHWSIGDTNPKTSLSHLVRSLWLWPLPFTEFEMRKSIRFPRLRRLAHLCLSCATSRLTVGAASSGRK